MTLTRREVADRLRRSKLLPQRARLAHLLEHLVDRAVALYETEDLTADTPEAAARAAETLDAMQETARQWVLDLADRGVFALWGIREAGDLVSVPLDVCQLDHLGHVGGTCVQLADWIVTGAGRARGWMPPGDVAGNG